ncbi:MAG: hypothetical protein OEW62_09490, partial [Candidatus Bathyarchaeota archaeon]|nr:hypothetical protein [Candidatus Bathyarchaeota archaeon]
ELFPSSIAARQARLKGGTVIPSTEETSMCGAGRLIKVTCNFTSSLLRLWVSAHAPFQVLV